MYTSAKDVLELIGDSGKSIADIVIENEMELSELSRQEILAKTGIEDGGTFKAILEDLEEGSGFGITGDNIAVYMDWFYNLPDEMKLTQEEYEEECKKAEPESTVRYRFTMDLSQGEDKEGVDRTFYIVAGVELP